MAFETVLSGEGPVASSFIARKWFLTWQANVVGRTKFSLAKLRKFKGENQLWWPLCRYVRRPVIVPLHSFIAKSTKHFSSACVAFSSGLKGAWFFFSKFSFLFYLKNHHSKISGKTVKPFGCRKKICILQLPIPYCVSLIMVTITGHIFINFFNTKQFLAVMGYEKNMSFQVIPKSTKVWKKMEMIGLGSFKPHIQLSLWCVIICADAAKWQHQIKWYRNYPSCLNIYTPHCIDTGVKNKEDPIPLIKFLGKNPHYTAVAYTAYILPYDIWTNPI